MKVTTYYKFNENIDKENSEERVQEEESIDAPP